MVWSLALVQYFLGVKVPTGFTAALVPPHVLTQVLLSDHAAVHRPLVPHALVGQSSCGVGVGGRREAASQHSQVKMAPQQRFNKSNNQLQRTLFVPSHPGYS